MAIILGVNLPNTKRGIISLTYIYGIGISTAKKILYNNNIDINKKVKDWTQEDIQKIIKYISSNIKIEGELRSEIKYNIKKMKDIGNYRGIRHRVGLPLRGQRTKNNSRTRKGKRKTVANKKKIIKK
ncbi:MAG: 30S ribosomal protein S13 [Candidatus Shikimatogenerans bostrichidophilus]|nr:MAG: 30S ribosomal protein S13 [Candidatus Shikimatogenerans bostrichidophilus]